MDPRATYRNRSAVEPVIHGDRRSDRRYPIEMALRYKLIRRKKVLSTGRGTTLDLSSGGILFQGESPLPTGYTVELAIDWPVLLHDVAPMQLVVTGRVVRSHAGRTAIRMTQHEFRTQGLRDASTAHTSFRRDRFPVVEPGVFANVSSLTESRKVH